MPTLIRGTPEHSIDRPTVSELTRRSATCHQLWVKDLSTVLTCHGG